MNPKVNWFFDKDTPWKEAYAALRAVVLDCGVSEQLRWGCPCYAIDGKNVVVIHGFKHYCAVLFFKGALLKDPKHLLVQQTENVQAARQMRFTSVKDVMRLKRALRSFVHEAIAVERAGLKVKMKAPSEFTMPDELAEAFKARPALKKAFRALTPGRQRGYLLYFASAKQSATREARIARHVARILDGRGLDD
jgi:uncharacterized protein YdeI (YjbR/CyaY-like superfamily)